MGLVLRIPFKRKLPFILHLISFPSSVFTIYQLPVFYYESVFHINLIKLYPCPGNFKKEKLKAKQTVLTFSSSNMFYAVQKILFTMKINVRFKLYG